MRKIGLTYSCILIVGLVLGSPGSAAAQPWTAHSTTGPSVRAGTVAGFSTYHGESVTAVGGAFALAQRYKRFTLEASYEVARLGNFKDMSPGAPRGTMQRGGVSLKVDFARLRATKRSLLSFYFEGGAGRQRTNWVSNVDFDRADGLAGGGWLLDHWIRFGKNGSLRRVGWHFGWRLLFAEQSELDPVTMATCTTKTACNQAVPAQPSDGNEDTLDVGLLVSSGLTFTW